MKHPYAELMLQYAQDAMETTEPWTRWEYAENEACWHPLTSHPSWSRARNFRRKPRTININGFEVPEPMREAPAPLTKYYVVDTTQPKDVSEWCWNNDVFDKHALSYGIAHYTHEAATIHAKALLSFTCPQQPSEIC